jgi:TP901 family phage tail tape measure protein
MAASAGAIRAGSAYVEIFARDGQFQQAMTRMRTRMMALGTQLRQAGTGMTLGGAAIGAPFILAARTAAAFSLEMARVRANTSATDGQFASLNESAKRMATQFGRSPEEVAGAMSELAKAGLDAEGVMKSISPILAVAAADNMDLARAVEVVVSTMAQFRMGTGDFGTIADKLQAAANASTTSVDSLGEALTYVGPKAFAAGQSIDDVLASLATLGDAGLRGSLGGTGLARIIESIANEEGKIAALGVSTRNLDGNMRPFMDIMDELGKKAPTANVDFIRVLTEIFEIRGANAAQSLSQMKEKFDQVMGAVQNSGGTAIGKATAVMSSFGGAVAQLGAQFGVFKIQVIESMGPIATQTVQSLTSVMQTLGQFVSENGQLVTLVAGSAAALFGFGVAALAAGVAIQGLATGLRVVQGGLAVIPALFTPVGLAVAALTAGIAGSVAVARTLSPAFREETDAIAAALMRLDFGAAWDLMNTSLAIGLVQMQQSFAQAFDLVLDTISATAGFMGDMMIEGMDRFMSMFGVDILRLQEGFEKLGNLIRWAFDWSFDTADLSRAFEDIERRVDAARMGGRDVNERSNERTRLRQEAADNRAAVNNERDRAFEDTLSQLRGDGERAIKRALGEGKVTTAETPVSKSNALPTSTTPAAPPGAFMPTDGKKQQQDGMMKPKKMVPEKDPGISSAGNFSGVGLDVGPELAALEDPARQTAANTAATAETLGELLGSTNSSLAAAAIASGQKPNIPAAAAATPPTVALDAVAPRATQVQQVAAQGTQAGIDASQIGVAIRDMGSDVVSAINEGTVVSRSILGVLQQIEKRRPTEAVFA